MAHGDRDVLGQTIDGRYAVVRHIADGGMASVYLASDKRLGRDVALKVLHPDLADRRGFAERFELEARSAARLSHPNVVAVQDQGRDGDIVFIVMEFVRGTTLRGVIDAGGLSVSRALALHEQLLAGLAAAHQRGLVHGDVKPENALVDDAGTVKLSDFGLVRAATTTERHDGLILGTEAYAAPEIVESAATPSLRSDVYSAGVVLRELLTGRRESDPDWAHQEVGAALAPVLERACAATPEDRFEDAGQFLKRVEEARAALPEHALESTCDGRPPASGATVAGCHTEVLGGGSHTKVLIAGEKPSRQHKPSRRRWLAAAGAVVVLGAGAWGLSELTGSSPRAIPGVQGKSTAAATSALKAAGFHVTVKQHSNSAAKGTAISTTPGAGHKADDGSTVTLFVSSGPTMVSLPNVVGTDEASARAKLTGLGLHVGSSERVASAQPAGQVVTSSPTAGSRISTATPVTLQISSGSTTPAAGQVSVPSVVGMTAGNARAVLGSFGLPAQTTLPDTSPVTSQTPSAGSFASSGSSVQLK